MNPEPVFRVLGFGHLVAILLTISIPVALGVAVRLAGSPRIDRVIAVCLALLLATNYLGYAIYLWRNQLLYWQQALPFQLCDWAMITVIVALLTGRRSWTEVSYFWGIGGTLQAILTPNLQVNFPDIRAISFFVGHGGIVAGVIYLLIARRFRPTLGSVWRTLAWSQLYLFATLLGRPPDRGQLRLPPPQTSRPLPSRLSLQYALALHCGTARSRPALLRHPLCALCLPARKKEVTP